MRHVAKQVFRWTRTPGSACDDSLAYTRGAAQSFTEAQAAKAARAEVVRARQEQAAAAKRRVNEAMSELRRLQSSTSASGLPQPVCSATAQAPAGCTWGSNMCLPHMTLLADDDWRGALALPSGVPRVTFVTTA